MAIEEITVAIARPVRPRRRRARDRDARQRAHIVEFAALVLGPRGFGQNDLQGVPVGDIHVFECRNREIDIDRVQFGADEASILASLEDRGERFDDRTIDGQDGGGAF